MQRLKETISQYIPHDAEEAVDQLILLNSFECGMDLLSRENPICHMTASAWVVNKTRTKVLMVYHNIYHSWSWTGGHADGEADLASVALREVKEETGVADLTLLSAKPFSLEVLTVERHMKNGVPISPHLHFNLTYLIEANEEETLFVKADENSGVKWFSLDQVIKACDEPKMIPIYEKLNRKLRKVCSVR